MTKENKYFTIFGAILTVVTLGIILVPKYFNSSDEDAAIKFMDFNLSLPADYFPRQKPIVQLEPTPKKYYKPKQATKPKQIVLEPNIDYSIFLKRDEETEAEKKRKEILAKLMIASFKNKIQIVTQKNDVLHNNLKVDEKDEEDPYLRASDYSKNKNLASLYINLERTIELNTMISAILLPTVNSTLDGPVMAMIEDNIYASHGRNILIPKGSKAYGRYIPLKKIGDERLAITWTKIRTPQGVNINLFASSADVMGRSGAIGELDNRWFMRFGLAITLSTVSNAVGYLATDGIKTTTIGSATTTDARNDIIRDYKNDISSITNQIIKEQKVEPTLEIPAGTRIYIVPIDDIWFSQAENNKVDVRLVNKIQSYKKGKNR
ncbi:TrbI/VirB10 family protein [Sulfurimonas sp.]|uniref:TrbI/VirB10 family protein n=1 Tax=Sulfurimonas sp. TaxID=2022749 RepID=UPI002B461469|nr:TrbI/VirB10 family protein [Sulfurimonas sp.]